MFVRHKPKKVRLSILFVFSGHLSEIFRQVDWHGRMVATWEVGRARSESSECQVSTVIGEWTFNSCFA